MRRLMLALLATSVLGSVASAADIPRKAVRAPVAIAAYDWTGWYFGAHLGGAWSRGDVSDSPLPNAAVAGQPFLPFDNDDANVMGGIQGGYNYQFNRNWVVGIEADFSFTNLSGSQTYAPIPAFPAGVIAGTTETLSREIDWFGSVRGRLGYAWDRWLVYATGGYAFAKIKTNAISIFPANVYSFSDDSVKSGWTVGGGLEYGLAANWTVRGEYLYYNFEDVSGVSFGVPSTAPVGSSYLWENQIHTARIALNYKPGWR
jgi:outer membrane immunogenic protein